MWFLSAKARLPFQSVLSFVGIVLVYIYVSKLCGATEEDF